MPTDEPPPTLGVREPRKPWPTTDTSGAKAEPERTPEPEAEAIAAAARVKEEATT